MLQAGDEAPDFSLESDEGDTVTLSALRGQPVVFYFYPKDDTPGCTAQACSLRDSYGDIQAIGATLYGISPDDARVAPRVPRQVRAAVPAARRHRSRDRRRLRRLGREAERKRSGIIRSSFVVGADGRILHASYNVKPEDTSPEALAALSA